MPVQLSEADQARVRRHLGYPELNRTYVRVAGLAVPQVDAYMIESVFDQLTAAAIPQIQALLANIELIKDKLLKATSRLAVSSLEGVNMRTGRAGESEPDLLRKEISYWCKELAATLAVSMGPGWVDYMDPARRTSNTPRVIT